MYKGKNKIDGTVNISLKDYHSFLKNKETLVSFSESTDKVLMWVDYGMSDQHFYVKGADDIMEKTLTSLKECRNDVDRYNKAASEWEYKYHDVVRDMDSIVSDLKYHSWNTWFLKGRKMAKDTYEAIIETISKYE